MDILTQRFAARWSRLTWIVTVVVVAIIVIATAGVLWAALCTSPERTVLRVMLFVEAFVLLGIFVPVVFFAPLAYTVNADTITIRRLGPDVIIRRERIAEIRRLTSKDIGLPWRLCGSGGFLGTFGYFYSKPLGRFRAYITNNKDLILITQADGSKTLISPCPADEFLNIVALRSR